jgi:hypothetical protein
MHFAQTLGLETGEDHSMPPELKNASCLGLAVKRIDATLAAYHGL